MKALVFEAPEVLVVRDLPDPVPGPGEVVVAVEARKSLQPVDAVVIAIGDHLARYDRPKPVLTRYDNLLEAQ